MKEEAVSIGINCIGQAFNMVRILQEEVVNKKAKAYHRGAWITIVEEMLMKAFMDRKETAKKASAHTIKIVGSVEVQRIMFKPKDSFAADYRLELMAFTVTMAYTGIDQTFKAFENSFFLNSCLS